MQKMIFTLGLGLLLLFSYNMQAQVNIALNVAPPYPVHLEDILKFEGQVVLTVMNQSPSPVSLKLLATIEGDNGIKIATRPGFQPSVPLVLTGGQTMVLTGAQLRNLNKNLTENDLDIAGVSINQLVQTEQLPEGMYTICVRAYNYQTGVQVSPEMVGCTAVFITWYDPPILTWPVDNANCVPQTPQFQLFNWTPSGQPGKTRYRFEMVDMTYNNLANPNDAFQTPAVMPFFKQENLFSVSLAYDLSKPALTKGHRYAWRVTAYDPTQSISFKNGGKSEVWSFVYAANGLGGPGEITSNPNPNPPGGGGGIDPVGGFQNPINPQMNYAPPCTPLECSPEMPQGPAVATGIVPGSEVIVGHFKVEIVTMQWTGTKINGTGRVYVPMFKGRIAVDISNLEVNAQGKAMAGTVTAQYDLGANVAEACKSYANGMEGVTPGMIKSIHENVENGKKYVKDSLGTNAKLPFAMMSEKMQQLQLINITAIEFKPQGARFNAFMSVDIPENNSTLGFGAKGICFHPNGLTGQTIEELHMVGDQLVLPFGEKIDLVVKGTGNQGGTYIKWDCEGYQEMQIEGEFNFSTEMLKPLKKNEDKVHGRFALNAAVWGDIVGQVSLDSFYITGVKNLNFHFQDVTVDFSDFRNPNGIKFPQGYAGNKDNTWRGFYFKQINATLPGYLKRANKSVELEMKDCIINKQGFTGKISVAPFFGINDGKVGNWAFSIQQLTLGFVNNSLTSSSFDGEIRVPISETGIGYHCALSSIGEELKTEFGINNVDDLDVKMWIAQMHLEEGSSISITVEGKNVICTTDFTGTITIQGEFKDLPSIDVQIPDMKFSHLVVSNGDPKLACQEFSFTSPQKTLNGFNISFSPSKAPPEFKDMVGVKLLSKNDTCNLSFGFMITLHEGGNGISGFSNLTIHSKLKNTNGLQWAYEKTRLNSIAVDATMSVVRIKGRVDFFYGDDKQFGKGFRGHFEVTFKPTFTADATVQFGKVNGFKYWFVDANVTFKPGIAVGPAFALYGFGGGAYYHMKPDLASMPDPAALKEEGGVANAAFSSQSMGTTYSGVKYVPDQGTFFGFKASVVIGTFPSPRPFNGDIALEAKINNNGSLSFIQLGVQAFFMCDVVDRSKPKVYGEGTITYKEDGGKRYFDADFTLVINLKPALSGDGSLNIHVESAGMEGDGGKWWVLMGTPDKRVGISILNTVEMGGYLMVGNQIPGPPELPEEFLEHLPYFKHTRVTNGDVAGFGFGLEFGFDRDFKFLIFYANLKMTLGFDVFVIDSESMTCPDNPNPGINGFYATGQMYAGFDAAVGIDINVWFLKAKFEIFHAYIYAGLAAGLPNPTWVIGEVAGGFEIFNGLAKGEFHIHFKVGEICDPSGTNPFGGLTIIADIAPKENNTSIFAVPEIAFNADMGKSVSVKTYSEDGEKIYYYRFHIQDIKVKRTGEVKNGKVVKITAQNYAGTADLIKPRFAQFSSTASLEPRSEYEVTARVYGEKMEDGKWVIIMDSTGKNKYLEIKKRTFVTGNAPTKFVDENIAFTYPHRMQRYLYKGDVSKGVIQFEKSIDLFDKKPENSAYVYKFIAKFTRIENGLHVTAETPLVYNAAERRVTFDIPDLMKERVYMLQCLVQLEKNPSQWLSSNASTGSKVVTQTINSNYKEGNSYLNTSRQNSTIEGTTVLVKNNEHELYRYFFRTSQYSSIKQKWDDYKTVSENIGTGDYSRRLTAQMSGKEPWGKYDLKRYKYYLGTGNDEYLPPLLNPVLDDKLVTPHNIGTGLTDKVYIHFYEYVRKFLYGGNQPCTEDALVKDWETIMANRAPRSQPKASEYPGNSEALAGYSFSNLESAVKAVGIKYTGDGATQLSMQEVTLAYGNGGNNNNGNNNSIGNFVNAGPQNGGGMMNNLPLLGPPPTVHNTMVIIWDFVHMSYAAREDFTNFLAGHGNMGLCENGFRDSFYEFHNPDDYELKFNKSNDAYKYKLIYSRPPGTSGSTVNFYDEYIHY